MNARFAASLGNAGLLVLGLALSAPLLAQDTRVKTLLDAAKRGDVDALNAALKSGVDVNSKGDSDWTALHAAAERGHLDVVKRLLEAGAKAGSKEYLGVTPLHWAACRGPREAVKALVDAGADVNAWCVQMDTPLGTAAGAGKIDLAEALLDAGADVNGGKETAPLVLAAKYGHGEMIRMLAKRGAEINDPKNPALHWAGKPEAAKALLGVGAKVDLRNPKGETALHLTTGAWVPTAETVKILLEAKADVNARSQTGATALHAAIRHASLDIVKLLLAAGINLDSKDEKGNTPLSLAEKAGPPFVAALKEAGAKEDGRPPLLRAIENGDLGLVKALLKEGADIKASGPGRRSAAHLAGKLGHGDILAELIRGGAKVDERDEDGLRPLHLAAQAAVAEQLIAAGAGLNPVEGDGQWTSPVFAAVMDGRTDVVRVLVKHKADLKRPDHADLLAWAAFAGRAEVVEILLEAGLPPNPKGGLRDESALHVVARGGIADMESPKHVTPALRLKIAQVLIDKGADVNAGAQIGYFMNSTPLMGASMSGSVDLARLLLDKGARANEASPDGMFAGYTALHAAAEGGHADVAKLLVERKADVNLLTGKGCFKGVKSPLDLCSRPDVRKLLVDHGGKTADQLKTGKSSDAQGQDRKP